MRHLALIILLALAIPAAAATSIEVHATLDPGSDAAPIAADAAPAQSADELAQAVGVDEPAVLEGTGLQAPDLIEATSLQGGAQVPATGIGFEAGASADDGMSPGERLVDAVLPAVEENAPAAVATLGLAALLQALGVWRVMGVGALALYSRLTRADLLDNTHRDRVYKLIQEKPGIGVSEIAAATGLGWGTTVYHLDRLERHSFVASERAGLHKCYFPVGTIAREDRKGIGALKTDTTRSIAAFLVAKPGATQTELCEALGLSPSAASKQVSKLETAGLVRRERDWKTVHLHPADSLPALLSGETAMPAAIAPPVSPAPLAA